MLGECLGDCAKIVSNANLETRILDKILATKIKDSEGLIALANFVAIEISKALPNCQQNCASIIADTLVGVQYHRQLKFLEIIKEHMPTNVEYCVAMLAKRRLINSMILDAKLYEVLNNKFDEESDLLSLETLKKYRDIHDKTPTEVINLMKLFAPEPIEIQDIKGIEKALDD